MPYLVVKEYSEGYAPGNWTVDSYWQHTGEFYYFDRESDAQTKKTKWEQEGDAVRKMWRIHIYEMKNGESFSMGADVEY